MPLETIAFYLGLVLFLGVHSVRIVADGWRARQIERLGAARWKGLYSGISLLGFGLLLWGFAGVRHTELPLLTLPAGMALGLRHLAALLMLPACWLIVAYHLPRSHFKVKLGHPMLLSVKLWALAHLLVNHKPSELLLFGGFLIWAVLDFRAARRRPGAAPAAPAWGQTAIALVGGTVFYAVFALWVHSAWLGVSPR
ncbi:NnrU family protein [Inhella gelatinilytica]|uniref:NnrU family protein n=1 Tax=Inhella gelatinilytica TaxID=2795030 RepID=A0A931NDJ9_9BURK|nr:NnrU family protein [Inhella gelatinilytica]MBH9551526.1 NnrU family protein [Inhella gelatinilytica]